MVHLAGVLLATPSPSPTLGANAIRVSVLLTGMIFGPAAGALLVALLPNPRGRYDAALRQIALWTLILLLGVAIIAYSQFAALPSGLLFEENLSWMPSLGISYHLGVDGVGMVALLASSIVGVVAVLGSWGVRTRLREYFALLLLAQGAVNGALAARDLFVFVLFWTAATVPLALLVAGWGGRERRRATWRLVAYWGSGSAALLAAVLVLWAAAGGPGFDYAEILRANLPTPALYAGGAGLLVAAATRLPLFPFHGWARDVLAEAPAGVAVLVAGSGCRLGGYLLLRMLTAFPGAAHFYVPLLEGSAAATSIAAGLMVISQVRGNGDIRRLGAYLAMVPAALTALAVAALTPMSLEAAGLWLFSGAMAAALAVGACAVLADRAQSREMAVVAGVAGRAPGLNWLVVLAALAVLGVPGFATWTSEVMGFLGAAKSVPQGAAAAGVGLVLVAAGLAAMLRRTLFGPPNPDAPAVREASLVEKWYLGVLVGVLLWTGIAPGGPKIAGIPIGLDPGVVNVVNTTMSDLAGPYVPPVPR